jgi:hypothetical protein
MAQRNVCATRDHSRGEAAKSVLQHCPAAA